MLDTARAVQVFDPATATEDEWRAFHAFRSQMLAERYPDDPPPTLQQTIASLRDSPAFIGKAVYVGWAPARNEIVAAGLINWFLTEENQHLGQFLIEVLPAWRRQGLGRRLLAAIASAAAQQGRRVLITGTYSAVPGGEAFMTRIGATIGLIGHTSQLDLTTLDPALIRAWLDRARAQEAEFDLLVWEGAYPDDQLPAMVELTKAANLAPRGDIEIEDIQWTAEQLRQQEAAQAARGMERWTMAVRDRATGELAGYTEVFWRPNKPALLEQGFTAVWPKYRNRGFGRWLKAAMLDKVLRERPQVRCVRTDNADSNAAMLKINQELGFQPFERENVWQIEVAQVQEYLAGRPA